MNKILVIEDNIIFRKALCNQLKRQGWNILETASVAQARKLLKTEPIDLVLSDVRLPDGDGIELLEWLIEQGVSLPPYIIATEYGEIAAAVRAIKLGAEDYICKPPDMDWLIPRMENLLKRNRNSKLDEEKVMYHRQSERFRKAEENAQIVAKADISVLIQGANGTGKEYIARLIHQGSPRKDKPFIAVDCGVLSKELAASELFGHKKGVFTGATENRIGIFQQAEGGTLFLDEIGNLPCEIQVMLLRSVQERKYRPIGATQELSADIRIVTATNENLETAIAEGRFREDLYHRLNEFDISLPNLSECPEDIKPFADFFLVKCCRKLNRDVSGFDKEAMKALRTYTWPGNVREMEYRIQRAVLLAKENVIHASDLVLPGVSGNTAAHAAPKNENEEREQILQALEAAEGNKKLAATILNIGRSTLYEKLKRYNIETRK